MKPFPEKCESINTVRSFCDCIGGDESTDAAAKGFCRRVAENSTSVTSDELVELKKALKDLEDTDETAAAIARMAAEGGYHEIYRN